MKLEVKSKRLSYEITIHGKYTIISGDSGTGKTTLFNMVTDHVLGNKAIKISCDKSVIALANNFVGNELENYKECLIIIDEYNLLLKRHGAASLLKNSDNYFVIITRKKLDYLPVSIDNYYRFENKGKLNVARSIFPRFHVKKFRGIKCIVTEDSVSGAAFFREYFPDVAVLSAHSKSEMPNYLKKNFTTLNGVLIVYDAAAFAFSAKELFETLEGHSVDVFDWESYENYILRNVPFLEVYNQNDMDCYSESLEQFSEERLASLVTYHKGTVFKCIKRNCYCGKCGDVAVCKFRHGTLQYDLSINDNNLKDLNIF